MNVALAPSLKSKFLKMSNSHPLERLLCSHAPLSFANTTGKYPHCLLLLLNLLLLLRKFAAVAYSLACCSNRYSLRYCFFHRRAAAVDGGTPGKSTRKASRFRYCCAYLYYRSCSYCSCCYSLRCIRFYHP